jgi:DNA-binding FadR family transcriptional regulator
VHHRHLREVGEVMGRLAAERAARAAEGESARIAAQIESLSRLEGVSLRELAFAHYNVVGDLSGSRAIALIVSIIGNLYALDEGEEADQVVIREVVPERLRALLEAILSGDGDRARRSMMLLQRSGARVRMRMRPLGALAESRLVRPLVEDASKN